MPPPSGAELFKASLENGWVAHRVFADGRIAAVTPMTYGKFRLTVGRDFLTYDDGW